MTMTQFSILNNTDIQSLTKSYITPEIARAAGLFRVDSVEGAEIVGHKSGSSDYSGLVFPNRWPGNSYPRSHRLRRDHPDLELKPDGSFREKAKYLSAPGESNRLYFAPSISAADLTSTDLPVVFVEGEKKTLALQRFFDETGERVLVIGLSGVWNWRGTVARTTNDHGRRQPVKGPIPDLDRIAWRSRKVEVIFDVDAHSNLKVRAARSALAREIASRSATVLTLEMPPLEETGCKGVDDLLGTKGADFVAAWLRQARQSGTKAERQTSTGGVCFDVRTDGVYAIDPAGEDPPVFVCSPLEIVARTRDERGENWGRLLRFPDADGRLHQWAMPVSLFSGSGEEYRAELLRQGLIIGSGRKARLLLEQYLNSKVEVTALCTSRLGWHRSNFILSDGSIGTADESVFFQSAAGGNDLLGVSGTLADWRDNIARYCAGNSRLAFAVSAAFAAPLLALTGNEGGGFHFRGATSTGKTTALLVAGSVWGGSGDKGFLRRWRATINGLESVAEAHNDALLCLDELAEVDPHEVGEVAYMLANGQGKLRQSRNITLRRPLQWTLLFLSSGEISLADHIAQAGKRLRGGQEIRLLDLPAEAGAGHGLFDDLHDWQTADELARHLRQAATQHYGEPIRAFLRQVAGEQADIAAEAQAFIEFFLKDHLPPQAGGEVVRVCRRFALVAFAGKLASEYGLTGWIEPEAERATARLFGEWLASRGTGYAEDEAAVRQVRLFLEQHGAARFQRLDGGDPRVIASRAGYVEGEGEETVWFILPEVFRTEVCRGFDPTQVARVLQRRNCLLTSHDLRYEKRTPEGKKKLYALTGIWRE